MKTCVLILFASAIVSAAIGQSPFVVVDQSEANAKAVAQYDQAVRRRIDFAVLRGAVNEFIVARKTISVGSGSDRYTVELQQHRPKDDWHLVDRYERVYVSGKWYWSESGDKVTVWFYDYSVRLTLTFAFTERGKCKKVAENIEDRRYIIE